MGFEWFNQIQFPMIIDRDIYIEIDNNLTYVEENLVCQNHNSTVQSSYNSSEDNDHDSDIYSVQNTDINTERNSNEDSGHDAGVDADHNSSANAGYDTVVDVGHNSNVDSSHNSGV